MQETAGLMRERTWRPPAGYRLALILSQGIGLAAAAGLLWLELWTNGAPGWSGLFIAVPLWGWLAFRDWTVAAVLTGDTLVIRNVLTTEQVAVADITAAGFNWQRQVLRVTVRRQLAGAGPAPVARHRDPGQQLGVTAVMIDTGAWLSGLRCPGDEAADAIRAAAGLPPLPPRKERVSRRLALVMIPAGLAGLVLGSELNRSVAVPGPLVGGVMGISLGLALAGTLAELGRLHARYRARAARLR